MKKKPYDIEKISELMIQYNYLSFKEKWQKIGEHFDRSAAAVRQWWHRNKPKITLPEVNPNDVSTDTIRTIYFLLFQKTCRLGFYQAIAEIQAFLAQL